MLQNAYFLAKIGADTAENEQHFAENYERAAEADGVDVEGLALARDGPVSLPGDHSGSGAEGRSCRVMKQTRNSVPGNRIFPALIFTGKLPVGKHEFTATIDIV